MPNVSIYYPELYSMKESDFDFFEKENFDLLLVCGWQRLIPEKILDAPEIRDDYYLNLMDWGNNGLLAVSLN